MVPATCHAQTLSLGKIDGALAWFLGMCLAALIAIVVLEALYTFRHYAFTLNRLFARQRPI